MGDNVYCYKNGPGCYTMAAIASTASASRANVVAGADEALRKVAGQGADGKQLHAIDVGDGEVLFVWAICLPDDAVVTEEQRSQRHSRESLNSLRSKLGLAPLDESTGVI